LKDQGKLDEAILCFRKALEIDPKHLKAHNYLADVLLAQGRVDEATAVCHEWIRLIELQPQSTRDSQELATRLQMLGYTQYRAGAWRESIETLEKSCKLQAGGTGDCGQWIVLSLAHARLAAQPGLPEKEREQHETEARRRYEAATKQIDSWWRVRPGHHLGQAIWDFREEARKLIDADVKNE